MPFRIHNSEFDIRHWVAGLARLGYNNRNFQEVERAGSAMRDHGGGLFRINTVDGERYRTSTGRVSIMSVIYIVTGVVVLLLLIYLFVALLWPEAYQ